MTREANSIARVSAPNKANRFAGFFGVAAIAAIAGGYFGGRFVATHRSLDEDAAQPIVRELAAQRTLIDHLSHQISAKSAVTSAASAAPDPQQIKVAVRAALDEREQDLAGEKAQDQSAAPSAESLAEYARGEQIIDDAIAAGQWTREDRAALHIATARVTLEQFKDLNTRVLNAFNDGKLELVR